MKINTDDYRKKGMYVHLASGELLDLSDENIKYLSDEYWNNPDKLPAHIREHEDFRTCAVCPYRGQNVFCSALKPLLPFLDKVEEFSSFDKVSAVHVDASGVVSVSHTTLQGALQYVTNMALFEYCEHAKAFRAYFRSLTPFADQTEAILRIYLNIYWLNGGNLDAVKREIDRIVYETDITARSCVKRLNVICQSDSFMNAYVKTQIFSQRLSMNIEQGLLNYFAG